MQKGLGFEVKVKGWGGTSGGGGGVMGGKSEGVKHEDGDTVFSDKLIPATAIYVSYSNCFISN